jgi:hypothetical protein
MIFDAEHSVNTVQLDPRPSGRIGLRETRTRDRTFVWPAQAGTAARRG